MDDEVDFGEGELDEDDRDVPSDIPGDGGQISFPVLQDLLEVCREHHRSKEGDIAARGGGLDDGFYNQVVFNIAAAMRWALENGQEAPSEVEVPEMLIDADGRHATIAPTKLPVMHQNGGLQLGHCLPDINDHGMVIHVVQSRKNAPQNTPDPPEKFDKFPKYLTPDFDGKNKKRERGLMVRARCAKRRRPPTSCGGTVGSTRRRNQSRNPCTRLGGTRY
jgi:hypothetical protein